MGEVENEGEEKEIPLLSIYHRLNEDYLSHTIARLINSCGDDTCSNLIDSILLFGAF